MWLKLYFQQHCPVTKLAQTVKEIGKVTIYDAHANDSIVLIYTNTSQLEDVMGNTLQQYQEKMKQLEIKLTEL